MRRVSQLRGKVFLFKPISIVFCTVAQAWTRRVPLFCFNQTSVVDDEEKTIISEQAAAREKFARPSKKRQQRRMKTWTTMQSEQIDPGG